MTLDVLTSAPAGATVATLARREARRTVRHPVNLVLLAYFIVLGGVQAVDSGLSANEAVPDFIRLLGLLWLGPATFFTANLIASSARRAHVESQLAATPTTEQGRTLATCLGVLGPTAAAAGVAVVGWLLEHSGSAPTDVQSPAELAVIPLCVLGGGMLGVAAARWLPWRGAPLIVFVAVFAWVVAVLDRGDLRWTAPWSMTTAYSNELSPAGGSHAWHAVYLLGLALLAGVAALLRHPSYRRPLLMLGAVLLVGTVAAGVAQLP
jgi:hypothetical protein